jgi:protein-S-isoprenylcysteine O-methyltransferase Ste14
MHSMEKRETPRLIVLPPVLPASAIAIATALEWVVPLRFLSEPSALGWQSWLGLIVAGAGFALGLSAVRAFRKAGTNVEPYKPAIKLVMDGPYKYSRNPIYVGFLAIYLGLSLMFSLEWGLILFPLLWFALDRMIVAPEEAYLRGRFGAMYESFLRQTRRWL